MSWSRLARAAVAAIILLMLLGGLLATHLLPGFNPWQVVALASHGAVSGPYGWLVFAAVQVLIALSGVLPASMLGILAGTLYGPWIGFPLAACPTMLGALGAFALSRSLFRPVIERMLARRPRLLALNLALSRDSWRAVCLLRLSPVMPFAATSYTLGLTRISTLAYTVGTLACLPSLFGYVLMGHFTSTGIRYLSHGASLLPWLVLGVGALATVALTLRIGVIIRRSGLISEQP